MAKHQIKQRVPSTVKPAPEKTPVKKKSKLSIPQNSKKANRYFVLFFFVWALILYGNTVLNKWAVDDNYVTHNDLVRKGFKAIPTIFSTHYLSQEGNIGSLSSDYRPIVKLTFAIEYALWGEKAPRSHLINILIYFWLSTVLFFVLKRLLRNFNILFPFLITVLFMAHPLHTEVVASLKNRDEMLAFLCGIGALRLILKYADTRKIIYPVWAMLVFFVGYLSKSSILPFLAVYPLVLYFFTDVEPKKILLIVISIFAVIVVAFFLPRMFLPAPSKAKSFIENPLYFEKNFWIRLGTGMFSLLFYLKMLVWPFPKVFYYGYNMIPMTNLGNFWVILSILIHLGLFVFALKKLKEKHILSFAILYYFITVSMYANIAVPVVGIVGERFIFAASLGFCIAIVWFLFKIFRTNPQNLTIDFNERVKIIILVFLVLTLYVPATVKRNRDWRNIRDLYRADIKDLKNSVKGNIEYGEYLMSTIYEDPNFQNRGWVNEFKQQVIISSFKQALALYPNDYKTLNDIGTVYVNFTQKQDSAEYYLKKAIALNPDLQPAWVNLGLYYRKKQNLDSAKICYEKILQINPKELNAVFKLADIYFDKGNYSKAFQMNEEVMKNYPELDAPYFNIGFYHLALGDTVNCIKNWEEAARRNPSFEVCNDLNILLRAKKEYDKANYYYSLGVEAAEKLQKQRKKEK
jgi:protein O-mannosyl-transferase